VRSGFGHGARLLRASYELVRQEPGLLWFPVVSICCVTVTAAFWIFEGAWIYAVEGPKFAYVIVFAVAVYSVTFVGIFFNVALVGAAARNLEGEPAGVGEGCSVAWKRLGEIAGWAAFSVFVSFLLALIKSVKGLRWLGSAAGVAWSFATLFVVPVIALEGLDPEDARRRSFELARNNWQSETGGLVALRAALLVPGLLVYVAYRLLADDRVHSLAGKVMLGCVLLGGAAVFVVASVVRQVFAVELYRAGTPKLPFAA
jgi:hypothetical protein